ncbi:DUF676 family protein [Medicago truncatula]|uniref:DUF676 family protein n=1 Tax=Medicago truncatula TaxID=3880 RepID=A0A072TVJ5_MEDTR|nr:DUF676 family protein [Medicago truncatula]
MCGQPARTVGWRDPGFIHTSFLKELWPNMRVLKISFLTPEVKSLREGFGLRGSSSNSNRAVSSSSPPTVQLRDVFYVNWGEVLPGATAVVSTLGGFGSEEQMSKINGEANVVAVNAAEEDIELTSTLLHQIQKHKRYCAFNSSVQKISFIAHSLGGLIARYAIAKLYERDISKELSQGNVHSESQISNQECHIRKYEGKIAGLEPINFITSTMPHLGCRGHKQLILLDM